MHDAARLSVNNPAAVNDAALKALGAKGVLRVSGGNVQVVLGPEADSVAETIRAAMGASASAPSAAPNARAAAAPVLPRQSRTSPSMWQPGSPLSEEKRTWLVSRWWPRRDFASSCWTEASSMKAASSSLAPSESCRSPAPSRTSSSDAARPRSQRSSRSPRARSGGRSHDAVHMNPLAAALCGVGAAVLAAFTKGRRRSTVLSRSCFWGAAFYGVSRATQSRAALVLIGALPVVWLLEHVSDFTPERVIAVAGHGSSPFLSSTRWLATVALTIALGASVVIARPRIGSGLAGLTLGALAFALLATTVSLPLPDGNSVGSVFEATARGWHAVSVMGSPQSPGSRLQSVRASSRRHVVSG